MELSDYETRISELKHYSDLASRLADSLNGILKENILILRDSFVRSLNQITTVYEAKKESLRFQAKFEGLTTELINLAMEVEGLSYEEANRRYGDRLSKAKDSGLEGLTEDEKSFRIKMAQTIEVKEAKIFKKLVEMGLNEDEAQSSTMDLEPYLFSQIDLLAEYFKVK